MGDNDGSSRAAHRAQSEEQIAVQKPGGLIRFLNVFGVNSESPAHCSIEAKPFEASFGMMNLARYNFEGWFG